MKYYKLVYADGSSQVVSAKTDLELIRKYDLANRANAQTKIIQYEGDQLAAVTEALRLEVQA